MTRRTPVSRMPHSPPTSYFSVTFGHKIWTLFSDDIRPENTKKNSRLKTTFNSHQNNFITYLPSSPVIWYTLSSGSVLIGVWGSPSSPAESPPRLSSRLRDILLSISPSVAVPAVNSDEVGEKNTTIANLTVWRTFKYVTCYCYC